MNYPPLHDTTRNLLGDFIGSWQSTTKNDHDKIRFDRFVNEMLLPKIFEMH